MTARTLSLTIAAAIACMALAAGLAETSAQEPSTVALIGADALIEGNTATRIGVRDACVSADAGAQVTIDIVVDEVPEDRPMIGFQMTILYDPALVTVSQADHDFLLGALGQYQPFAGLSDPLPDTDGKYKVGVADLSNAGDANSETGKGVLARITFDAKSVGQTTVGPFYDGNFDDYPYTIDTANEIVGVDSIASTVIAVGQECPVDVVPEDQVTELPPLTDILNASPAPTPSLAPGETAPPTVEPSSTITPSPSPQTSPGTSTPAQTPEAEDGTDTIGFIVAGVLGGLGLALLGGGGYLLVRRRSEAGRD